MLYLKGMPNLIDFDERIFLHAIRFCIIILCLKYTLIFLPKEIIAWNRNDAIPAGNYMSKVTL